ncbi:hypothetical protein EYF80_047532 [Liparis tanakae]|uniref:Uncharacterized protein n=1 Tax=Liparis tanakae TaxID=230148 RepID=A0A4Z2FND1_9TELE|nr:hypothetical protein EYF80_047532 [Liparis tanakae]
MNSPVSWRLDVPAQHTQSLGMDTCGQISSAWFFLQTPSFSELGQMEGRCGRSLHRPPRRQRDVGVACFGHVQYMSLNVI